MFEQEDVFLYYYYYFFLILMFKIMFITISYLLISSDYFPWQNICGSSGGYQILLKWCLSRGLKAKPLQLLNFFKETGWFYWPLKSPKNVTFINFDLYLVRFQQNELIEAMKNSMNQRNEPDAITAVTPEAIRRANAASAFYRAHS